MENQCGKKRRKHTLEGRTCKLQKVTPGTNEVIVVGLHMVGIMAYDVAYDDPKNLTSSTINLV